MLLSNRENSVTSTKGFIVRSEDATYRTEKKNLTRGFKLATKRPNFEFSESQIFSRGNGFIGINFEDRDVYIGLQSVELPKKTNPYSSYSEFVSPADIVLNSQRITYVYTGILVYMQLGDCLHLNIDRDKYGPWIDLVSSPIVEPDDEDAVVAVFRNLGNEPFEIARGQPFLRGRFLSWLQPDI